MPRAVGVDIGERFLKVVEVVGSSRSFRVQRVAVREIPAAGGKHAENLGRTDLTDDLVIEESGELHREQPEAAPELTHEEQITQIISDVFTSLKLPREDVCATFPAHVSVNREIVVPFFEEDQIRKVVRFEAENHLHSHSIEDVVVNWVKTGETKDGSRLTIFASPKMALAEHVACLRRARVDPASVDLDATAMYTTLDAAGIFEEHPNVIVVEVGASASTLMLMENGRPRVLRSFRLGIGGAEGELSAELGVSHAQTRRVGAGDDLLMPAADLPPPDLPSAEGGVAETEKSLAQLQASIAVDHRTQFVTKLHREAVRSLASVSTDTPPDRILILGGGSLIPGVPEALSERFGLPVERLNLLDHLDCRDEGADREFNGATLGAAVGCALRMLGRNPLGIELLQEEFSPRNTFEVIRTTLATSITLLFLALGLWTFALKEQLKAEITQYNHKAMVVELMTFKAEMAYLQGIGDPPGRPKTKDLAQRAARGWVRGLPMDEKRVNRMQSLLIRRHRFLQSELGLRSDITPLPSALKCMFEFYKALSAVPREQLAYLQVHEMIIQERRATVKVIVDKTETLDTVARLLRQSKYFKDRARDTKDIVEIGAEQPIKGGYKKQSFTFSFADD